MPPHVIASHIRMNIGTQPAIQLCILSYTNPYERMYVYLCACILLNIIVISHTHNIEFADCFEPPKLSSVEIKTEDEHVV